MTSAPDDVIARRPVRGPVLLLLLVASLGREGSCARCSANCSCEPLKVNCDSKNLSTFPEDLPLDTRQLKLANNKIASLSSVSLNVLMGLVYLDCSNNLLNGSLDATFAGQPIVYLDLSKNRLNRISATTFNMLPSLVVLKLSDNPQLSGIDKDAFANNLGLRELDLRNSSLTYLDFSTVSSLPDLSIVHLSGNPWHCDCSLRELSIWMHFTSVSDFDKITCAHSTEDPEELQQHHPVLMMVVIEKLNRICFTNLKQKDYIFLIFIGFTVFCLGTVVAWVAGICIVLRNRLCKSGDDDEDYVEDVVEADTPVTNRHLEKEDDNNFYVHAHV